MASGILTGLPAHETNVLVDGEWLTGSGSERISVVNPATAEQIATVPGASAADVHRGVTAARRAFPAWAALTVAERVAMLQRLHDALTAVAPAIEATITAELGSPVSMVGPTQVASALQVLRDDMRIAGEFEYEQRRGRHLILHEPIGVVGVITPWNFPMTLAMMKIAPALAAGNTVVFKPAELTPLSSWLLGQAALDAGLPPGVLNVLPGYGTVAGAALAGHPGVDVVSFTGSVRGGREVAAAAAANVTKVVLELGGKSAAVVLDGADLEPAVTAATHMAMANSGQVCAAWSRMLVPAHLAEAAIEIARATAASLPVGDPLDPSTMLGPVVSDVQRDKVLRYIGGGQQEGARLVLGGADAPEGLPGYFVAPTVFADVDTRMTIAQEEIFGPVLSIIAYRGEDEAVQLANDSAYGLHGGVFAADQEQAEVMARKLRVGQVFVNGLVASSDAPFGGYKQSGYGRTGGPEGFTEILQTKAILS
jgi:aldehyde dehydrogenase (NAD+)